MSNETYQRKKHWAPTPRPEWLATMNKMTSSLDMKSVVPLDAASLINQATSNTGLDDFGDEDWIKHFNALMQSIEDEADLHFAGRVLTRSEFVRYLEIRLNIVECYKQSPDINNETIDAPVFIFGLGRSGTTILYELLAQDPQFRSPSKWESLYPCPPPEQDSYDNDPRIAKAERANAFNESLIPELNMMHKSSAKLPVESVELVYFTFLSEVFASAFQVPSYDAYVATQDMRYCFAWQKKLLKLLQWRCKAKHWLLKGPSHLPYLTEMLDIYPGARIIFTHRDPIVTADSVVSLQGTLYWWRSDNPWGDSSFDNWIMGSAESRAKIWDGIIEHIEDGKIDKNNLANFQYSDFMNDPMASIKKIYADLSLTLTPQVEQKMQAFLDAKPQGKYGEHNYQQAPDEVIAQERQAYKKYQDYFGIANEL
jgi:hypothetical protein